MIHKAKCAKGLADLEAAFTVEKATVEAMKARLFARLRERGMAIHGWVAGGLASAGDVWHFSRVRFLLPVPLLLILLFAGCASSEKQLARQEAKIVEENSRLVEQRRMQTVTGADVASARGAEILIYDPHKTYDPTRHAVGGRTYAAGSARTKAFQFSQKTNPRSFATRDFAGAKPAGAGRMLFATKAANTRDPYATKTAATRTAETKESRDAGKTAAVHDLHDGRREFLGKESGKLRQAIDPATLGDWRKGGETVSSGSSSVEKYSTMKQLTIEDIRELLNKSK